MSSIWKGRLNVALAGLLWSLSGFFVKVLTEPPNWLKDIRPVPAEHIACWRCLFGALFLMLFLRPRMIRWHPLLPVMAFCFAIMNGLFILAMAQGDVATSSLLQYTAPFWVFIVHVVLLRKAKAISRDWWALGIATAGILVIVLGRFQANQLPAATLALGAGIASAGVILGLSLLIHYSSVWLAFCNLLVAGLFALPWAVHTPWPVGIQWVVLALFGVIQVALPYWLMSRAVQSVPAHEAALISLLDPLLAPFWAYGVTHSVPSPSTWLGGAVFLLALIIRYLPVHPKTARTK